MSRKLSFVLILLIVFLASSVSTVNAQQVWFSPRSGSQGVPDYLDLFQENAQWQNVASHISVIGVASEFILRTPEADLKQVFADLKRRNIKLGVALLALSGRPKPDAPECGVAVEGYSAPGEALLIARKVKRLGGTIDYFTMDEPLYFGRHFDRYEDRNSNPKRRGCHLSIREIAEDAAARIRDVRSVFPEVKVGDCEPFMEFEERRWQEDLSDWFDAFDAATGQKLAYFTLDLRWKSPWKARMARLIDLLGQKGIPLHVIYNGSSTATSDADWVSEATQRFQQFEAASGLKPEAVVLQTWAAHPSRALPESDPTTMTGYANQYLNWKRSRGETVIRRP
jgi:hypothetical protein